MYKFAKKYGTNVDGYSPIYTPDSWSAGGGSYKLGVKGLIAWYVLDFVACSARKLKPLDLGVTLWRASQVNS